MTKTIDYLNAVAFRVAILKSVQADYELQLSNKFNVFQYIGMDENQMSRIFADLLNPNGAHGQRAAYLDAFMHTLKVEKQNGLPKVDTEVLTDRIDNTKRRMDIVIAWADFAIGIENKPRATDQTKQLSDYKAHLQKKYKGNYLLVYLSETEPSEDSISKKEIKELGDKYKHIDYAHIINWLGACINVSQSEKMRYFLKDFQTVIKTYFSNMETPNTEIVNFSLSSLDNLEAACEVINAYQSIKNAIAKAFVEKLIKKLEDEYQGLDVKNETDGEYIRVFFTKSHWTSGASCKIGHDPGDMVYFSTECSKDNKFYDFLKKVIPKGKYKHGHFHYYNKDVYSVWDRSTTGMKAMYKDESINYFFKEIQLLIDAVDEYHKENKIES